MASFSRVNLSQLEGAHRLDAEYYQPEYLDLERKLDAVKTKTLEEVSKSVISFGAYSLTSYIEWQESGVPYVNVANIHDGYVDISGIKHISDTVDEILKKSRVQNGQVLLTMAGTIGNAAVAYDLEHHMNANQAIAKIAPLDISPYYLVAFLNSRYGRLQTSREIVSSVQANIFLGPIKKFRIPIFSDSLMIEIENRYKTFLETLKHAQSFYHQAEQLLLRELGLDEPERSDPISWVVQFSDVRTAERCDAEYFQPKYERILKTAAEHARMVGLGDLVSMRKGVEPGSEAYAEEGRPFIRVSSVTKFGLDDGDQKYLSAGLYESLRGDYQPKVGELLLTKDATPGVACVVREPIDGIVAGGVLRVTVKNAELDPEYLALCINSVIGQSQVERHVGGSIIAHWQPKQIKELQIPMLAKSKQQKISELVRQSHTARTRAKQLFEEAKKKVEQLIEQSSS